MTGLVDDIGVALLLASLHESTNLASQRGTHAIEVGPEVALLDCRSNDDGSRLVEMGCARIAIGAPSGRVRAAADVRRGVGDVGAR